MRLLLHPSKIIDLQSPSPTSRRQQQHTYYNYQVTVQVQVYTSMYQYKYKRHMTCYNPPHASQISSLQSVYRLIQSLTLLYQLLLLSCFLAVFVSHGTVCQNKTEEPSGLVRKKRIPEVFGSFVVLRFVAIDGCECIFCSSNGFLWYCELGVNCVIELQRHKLRLGQTFVK